MPPVEHGYVRVALDTVEQLDTTLVEDDLGGCLPCATDMSPACAVSLPHGDAIPACDEGGLLHGVVDDPHRPQNHAGDVR